MIIIIIIVIVVLFFIIASFISNEERKDELNNQMSSPELNDFTFTQKLEDKSSHRYVVGIDNVQQKVLIATPSYRKILNYSDIISVELVSDGITVASRSFTSLAGATAVAGLVGAMAVNQKINEKVRELVVKISTRNLDDPIIKITTLLEFDYVKINEFPYNSYLQESRQIVDMIKIVIDTAEKAQLQNQTISESSNSLSIADELAKIAELKAKGILTEEEFQSQKTKLLNN